MHLSGRAVFIAWLGLGCQAMPSSIPPTRPVVEAPARSLEARATRFLQDWSDAMNSGDSRRLLPFFHPGTSQEAIYASREAGEVISARMDWGPRGRERPLYLGAPTPEEKHTAYLNLEIVRMGPSGRRLVDVNLILDWAAERPRIVDQSEWVASNCRDEARCTRKDRSRPLKVNLSYRSCVPGHPWYESEFMSDCMHACAQDPDAGQRENACRLLASSYFIGECGLPKDLQLGLKYAAGLSKDRAITLAGQLPLSGDPQDAEAALRLIGCYPSTQIVTPACASGDLQLRALWATQRPEWQQAALDRAMARCPLDPKDPCQSLDWECELAATLLEGSPLGKAQPELVSKYRQLITHRAGVCPSGDDD